MGILGNSIKVVTKDCGTEGTITTYLNVGLVIGGRISNDGRVIGGRISLKVLVHIDKPEKFGLLSAYMCDWAEKIPTWKMVLDGGEFTSEEVIAWQKEGKIVEKTVEMLNQLYGMSLG